MTRGVDQHSARNSRRLGVCSWSLRPRDEDDLALQVSATSLRAAQVALVPLETGAMRVPALRRAFEARGLHVLSGMWSTRGEDYSTLDTIRRTGGVRPDEHWEHNLASARACARIARELDCDLVTFHAGFLPHDRADRERAVLLERLRRVVGAFAEAGVRVGFETGQETAATLLDVLAELDAPNAGVNFDPANMILYGMGDPVEALAALGPRVVQVHVKDARRAHAPGTWGTEVPAGTGEVDWPRFFDALARVAPRVDLVVEREAGEQRVVDVARARELVLRTCRDVVA